MKINKELISIVIPALNEAENLTPLCQEIAAAFSVLPHDYEIIIVDDGSRDKTKQITDQLFHEDPNHIRVIQFRNNFGKAAALHAGFQLAKGDIIIQMDADLQDDPAEIPRFIEKIHEGFDLVVGWKKHRLDGTVKNKTSRIFNGTTNLISLAKLHDHNCGFKAYRADTAKGLNIYGELHRYIGVIISNQGYLVAEIPVNHRKRLSGSSKYGPIRFIHGFLDLLTVVFITKFRSRPLHLFGYLGITFFLIGISIALYLLYVKFLGNQSIGDRPLLLFSVMFMIMGVQIGVTGLVGEQIATMINKSNDHYVIRKVLK